MAAWRFLPKRLAAAGRLALSDYLATSVILASHFSSGSLGLFGQAGRIGTYTLALLPSAAMLLWSKPLPARKRAGPAAGCDAAALPGA